MATKEKTQGNRESKSQPSKDEALSPIRDGYLIDFISGKPVKDGPEEREAVQVFARMLVEDYGYPKTHIQTRPQHRVKVRPSDTKKEYPIDIAVFGDGKKNDDDLYIVVECKKEDRKDGKTQLQDYLRLCKASLGVWFNGRERLFLKKTEKGGRVLFEEIPNIPIFGQRVEDVGLFRRKDLKPATNLKAVFKTIRNFLAANAVGITRDEVFAQQIINLIFCKIYDERFTKPRDIVTFRAGVDEEPKDVRDRIVKVAPQPDEKIIDPACGSGGFLVEALRHVWRAVDERGQSLGWPEREIDSEKQKVAIEKFRGIDKDAFLSKVAKSYMAILGDGRGGVFCENSLDQPKNWDRKTRNGVQMGSFDVVITNPPFGKKLAIESEETLKTFELGHEWKSKKGSPFMKGGILDKQPPQILFIERCFDLLCDGGRMGIVLLESIFGMPKYRYVVDFINKRARILAIVTLPEDLFQPFTHAKTCVVLLEKTPADKAHQIFMCDVKWCGHDSRGNPTWFLDGDGKKVLLDEVPLVAPLYTAGPTKGAK